MSSSLPAHAHCIVKPTVFNNETGQAWNRRLISHRQWANWEGSLARDVVDWRMFHRLETNWNPLGLVGYLPLLDLALPGFFWFFSFFLFFSLGTARSESDERVPWCYHSIRSGRVNAGVDYLPRESSSVVAEDALWWCETTTGCQLTGDFEGIARKRRICPKCDIIVNVYLYIYNCECACCASSRRSEPWWPWELRLLRFFIIIIIIIILER